MTGSIFSTNPEDLHKLLIDCHLKETYIGTVQEEEIDDENDEDTVEAERTIAADISSDRLICRNNRR